MKASPLTAGAYDQNNITQFLAEYCRSVQFGTHLYKREFEYVMLTTRNRLSFIRLFEKQFLLGLIEFDTISVVDFFSLVELLCPDFPIQVVEDTFQLLKEGEGQIPNILEKLRFRLFFDEFFESSRSELIPSKNKNRKIVVPTSEIIEKRMPLSECQITISQLTARFRDATKHTAPKIYSIDEAFEKIKQDDTLTQSDVFWMLMRNLTNDSRVTDFISSFES